MNTGTNSATDDQNTDGGHETTTQHQDIATEQPEGGDAGDQEQKKELTLEAALKELKEARSQAARYRTERNALNEAAEKWKQHEDSQKSELQLAQERLAELEQELGQAQSTNLLLEIATTHGIKADDMALLGTGTREELEARAARIKELYGGSATQAPLSNTPHQKGNPGSAVGQKPPTDDTYPESWMPAALRKNK